MSRYHYLLNSSCLLGKYIPGDLETPSGFVQAGLERPRAGRIWPPSLALTTSPTSPARTTSAVSLNQNIPTSGSPTRPASHCAERYSKPPPSYQSSPQLPIDPPQLPTHLNHIPPIDLGMANLASAHSTCSEHPMDPRSLPRPDQQPSFLPDYFDSTNDEVVHNIASPTSLII